MLTLLSRTVGLFALRALGAMTDVRAFGAMTVVCAFGAMVVVGASPASGAEASTGDDYPTAARAEFVFACMASNGQTQQALRQCSCAIDVIASVLPYERYEQAETVLSMRRTAGGYLGEMFRTATTNNMVRDLEEAQAEGEIRCF